MKRKLLSALLCMGAMFATNVKSNAQSILIHYWNFNSFNTAMYTPTISAIPADYTRITSPTASVLYTGIYGPAGNAGSYVDTLTADLPGFYDFDTVNLRMGATEGTMLRCRNNSDSMELLFNIPSTHYTNLELKYGTEASSHTSGMLHQIYSYSNDNGTTWITSGSGLSVWSYDPLDTFALASVHFNDAASSNNPNLVFRITFSGNTHLTPAKGNNRFDNITLEGDTTTATSTESVNQVVAQVSYTLYPNPVANLLNISSDIEGAKSVTISNTIGQTVYAETEDNRHIAINTANLCPGVYVVSIRENSNGNVTNLKFIKQ